MMVERQTQPHPPPPAAESSVARVMGGLYQLALEAFRGPDRKSVVFTILNDTINLIPYERASLWNLETRRPALMGISGQASVNSRSELAEAWQALVERIEQPAAPQSLGPQAFADIPGAWETVQGTPYEKAVLWVPISAGGRSVAGLWLERPATTPWSEDEAHLLQVLADGYGAALNVHRPRLSRLSALRPDTVARKIIWACLISMLLYVLFFFPVRMRVVAPCKVVPDTPLLVTAPLDGVVEELNVQPGEAVEEGQALFRYEAHVAQQDLDVARQQVAIVRSQLERATILALTGEATSDEVAVLTQRLKQEQARLDLARYTVERLVMRAPRAGVVQIERPHEWKARPVRLGEAVLTLVDPKLSRVRIWIPESDKLPGIEENPCTVFLDASPAQSLRAEMAFVANAATVSPDGVPGFVAEATWSGGRRPLTLGLTGTAVLHGEYASIAYWVFRKPWLAVRTWLGV